MQKIFLPLILSAVIFLCGCGHEDTPESALNDIKIALETRDKEKISRRVDFDEFFSTTYDVVTDNLAQNHDFYQKKYPDDPYFQHNAGFLTNYNAEHKNLHLNFLRDVLDAYFDKIPAPNAPEDNPTAYVANEFEFLRRATDISIKKTVVIDDSAMIEAEISGDDSLRGNFFGKMTFNLEFRRDNENFWHFVGIKNLNELMPALVDRAEVVWINF